MSRGLARVGGFAVALILLVLVTVLAVLDRPREATPASVASVADDGRRAAFLLLEALGFAPVAWNERPGLLPRGRHVVWLPGVPVDPHDTAAEEDGEPRERSAELDPLELARAGGLRSPRHYRGFLEQGGRVVAPLEAGMLTFLADELGLVELADCAAEEIEPLPTRAELPGGESLELELPSALRLVGLDPALPREPLVSAGDGTPLALEVPVGRGGLVLLASDAFLDNERLRDGDHALLLVRLAEALGRGGALHFDEHALGLWGEEGQLTLALRSDARPATLHALLLALLLAWALAWPREFPRDPEPLQHTAPLERARAQAALALRAGRPGALAPLLVSGTLHRVARRLRVPLEEEGEPAGQLLGRLAAAAGLVETDARLARWRAAVLDRGVNDRNELARLDADLRALEAELLHLLHDPSPADRERPPDPA